MVQGQANKSMLEKKKEGKPGKENKWCKHCKQLMFYKEEAFIALEAKKAMEPVWCVKDLATAVGAGADKQDTWWEMGLWMVAMDEELVQ